jgi:hypothetical protein
LKHLFSIFTLCVVSLTAVAVNADEKEDRDAIRALFHQEQEGHAQGNADMVRSTYWDDFYIINLYEAQRRMIDEDNTLQRKPNHQDPTIGRA